MLPPREVPEHTEGREGFFHMDALSGDTAAARLEYIVRDHDREKFEARKELLRGVEKAMTEKYPTARVELALKDSYYNMLEQIDPEAHPMEAKRQPAEYPEPYIVKLSVLHAGGFEDTIQNQCHGHGQYTFEE